MCQKFGNDSRKKRRSVIKTNTEAKAFLVEYGYWSKKKRKEGLSICLDTGEIESYADFAYKNHACDKVLENKQVLEFSNEFLREGSPESNWPHSIG